MTEGTAGFEGRDAASGLTWRFRPAPRRGAAGILAVVFSQMRVPEGRFGLERLFAHTGHACLFLNCPDPVWYLGCEAATDAAIDAAVAAAAPRRIVHYGASKGAHGALAAALRRGDGEAFAFAPELVLGRPGSQSAGAVSPATAAAPDLAPAILSAGVPTTIVFGIFDPVDAEGAVALSQGESARRAGPTVLRLASPHAVHDHLYTLNIARKLIAGFERDLAPLCAERGLIAPDTDEELARFAAFAAAQARGRADDGAVEAALADPYLARNPGYALAAAKALHDGGAPERAAGLLAATIAALETAPGARALPKRWLKGFWRARIDALTAAGDTDAARDARREAMQRFPSQDGW
jgi:hypothetical protein